MNAIDRYAGIVRSQFDQILESQRASLEAAAAAVAGALMADRYLYAFGTGHSHMVAEEVFYRAGGLVRAAAILDPPLMLHEGAVASTRREREPGYAATRLDGYPVAAGDVLIVASNSGRNIVPIEMAMVARDRGLTTIAITSVAYGRAFASRHPSGRRLMDVVDIVLDNGGVPGDAVLDIEGLPRRVGPTSTLGSVMLVNALVVRAIEISVNQGHLPEVYASSNADVPGWNEALIAAYQGRIRHL